MSAVSDLMVDLESTNKSGGDGITKNANRAFAWFIAGIVASIIVSILMMIIGLVVGFSIDSHGLKTNGSVLPIFLAALLSVGIAFATAGAVYESFVGCP
jgi:hypothetical protein